MDARSNFVELQLKDLAALFQTMLQSVQVCNQVKVQDRVSRLEALYACTQPSIDEILNELMANRSPTQQHEYQSPQPDPEASPAKETIPEDSQLPSQHPIAGKCLFFDVSDAYDQLPNEPAATHRMQSRSTMATYCQTSALKHNRRAMCNGRAVQTLPTERHDVSIQFTGAG
ncbi:unnamed protein product [Polarella glacialis]|uniref:Uncharacterized protein n=1 Tax=Polarella glacialis TaxID=89957 RepID=A0A813HYI6_POLGL|nr:unnamed protein product [Polarella glacialis]